MESGLIEVVIGPRRAGKSVFALQMLQGREFAYVNFDDERLLGLADFDDLPPLPAITPPDLPLTQGEGLLSSPSWVKRGHGGVTKSRRELRHIKRRGRKNIRIYPSHSWLAAVILVLSVGRAEADFLGDTLKPFASVTETYDSNVFRVKDRERLRALVGEERLGDFITVATVGTGVHYRISRQELNLLLKRDFIRFGHYTNQDADRDEASGNLALTLLDRVRIRVDGSYAKAPQSRTDFRSAALNKVTNVAGGVAVGYEMTSGVGFEAAYRRATVDYSLPQFRANEYSVDRYSGTLSYLISPEARVYASYQREDTDYEQELALGSTSVNNSNVADSVRIGLEKTFSPRTAVSGYIGYLDRRHRASSARDFSGAIGRAAITYGLTAKLGLKLNWERQISEETYADRIYSVSDSVGAGLVYQLSEKVKGSVFERVSWKDFRDVPGSGVAPRTDFTHELNAGIEWAPVKGLAVNVGYQYSERSSDDATFDFTDHAVSTGVAYRF